jgi:geranylgeranyl diphosphate synthase, type II
METSVLKLAIENWLDDYFSNKADYNKGIYESMYYSLQVGGKRIRPMLFILSYMLYKDNWKSVLPMACGLEMIHTYSLIHDDLPCMDNDDLRRGKPTNHKVFGEAVAVLAGDALLNEAFSILFKYCLDSEKSAVKACRLISEASGAEGMIAGQIVDIMSEGKSISRDELFYMHKKKTGELIKASIVSGAILGGAPQIEAEALERYGEKLGLAFQIKDDILDVTGETALLGKKTNSDVSNNKSTFVTMYGIDKCKEKCIELTQECIEILRSLNKNTNELEELTFFLLKREF